jgi:hypothetical protein
VPLNRVLGDKKGDQQSRTELLGKLLVAAGDKPFMLRHGSGRQCHHVILVTLSEEELTEAKASTGRQPAVVRVGPRKMVPLQLQSGKPIGDVETRLYDPEKGRWTGSIAVMRCK